MLIDPKGKRVHALRHGVALTPAAHKEVRALQALAEAASNMAVVSAEQASPPVSAPPRGRGKPKAEVAADPRPYLISTDGGSTHVSAITLTRWAQAAGSGIPNFQLKQVRSGVETALAGAKISLDLRGLLQSHGLSSLQRRHYDGHDYTPELKTVLLTLGRLLNQEEKSKANSRRANKPKPAT